MNANYIKHLAALDNEEKIPSFTSLWRHWLRTCWVAKLWRNSAFPDAYSSLSSPEQSGWIYQPDGTYRIDWEAAEVQQEIQHTMDFLLKRCGCKETSIMDVVRSRVSVTQGVCAKVAQIYGDQSSGLK